jgi:lipid A 4'-phosphatase
MLFWQILLALAALAMVPTLWSGLDLQTATWFAGPGTSQHIIQWWWVELINLHVPAVFRGLIFLALAGWIMASLRPAFRQWRLPLAFVVLCGALGPGLLVNSGFKEHWQRARPYEVQNFGGNAQFTRAGLITDQCHNNCSFVSGHVACGFFFASLMLVAPRRRRMWAAVGLGAAVLIGFARMADMAHWLSDVLWAGPITLLCSWVIWRGLLWAYSPEPSAADTGDNPGP